MSSQMRPIRRRKSLSDRQVSELFREFAENPHKSRSEIAAQFDMPYQTIVYWEREYRAGRQLASNNSN